MRGFLKISLMLILGPQAIDSTAQELMPLFGEPTRTWTSSFGGATDQICSQLETASHWIDGDTLIEGIAYKRVRSHIYWDQSYIMGGPGECDATAEYPGLTAFVREDSNRVYRWAGIERLIYDFNAQAGDTIPSCGHFNAPPEQYCYSRIIEFVDSVEINGSFRKRMRLMNYFADDTLAIIEGIGSTSGLFSLLDLQVGLSHFQRLICVREYGEIIFGDGSCMLVNSVPERVASPIRVHPNPSTGIIHFSDQLAFEVFDPTGRMMRSGRSTTTDLSDHPSGIYFVRTLHDGQWSHHKVILEK